MSESTRRKPAAKKATPTVKPAASGADIGRLSHSSIQITTDRYGHLFPRVQEALAEALDAAFRPRGPTDVAARIVGPASLSDAAAQ